MRKNVINNDFYMINLYEVLEKSFNDKIISQDKFKSFLQSIKMYQEQTKRQIDEIAIKEDNPIRKYFNLDETFTKDNILNSLSYSVVSSDENHKDILLDIIKKKYYFYRDIQLEYGNDIVKYIIENGNYEYMQDLNIQKEKDSSIYYLDEKFIICKLTLNNDVKQLKK